MFLDPKGIQYDNSQLQLHLQKSIITLKMSLLLTEDRPFFSSFKGDNKLATCCFVTIYETLRYKNALFIH